MNQRALVAAAAASLLSTLLVATPAAAQEKEKCYGIAKAENAISYDAEAMFMRADQALYAAKRARKSRPR